MSKHKSWYGKEIELTECPFCGGTPIVIHRGNDLSKKRSITIKCSKCRIKRTDAAIVNGFDFLERVAVEQWNQRDEGKEKDQIIINLIHSILSNADWVVETPNEAILVKLMELKGMPINYKKSVRDIDEDYSKWRKSQEAKNDSAGNTERS